MINNKRLIEIIVEAERIRCSQINDRYGDKYPCECSCEGCRDCIMKALNITKEEYNEIFKGEDYYYHD